MKLKRLEYAIRYATRKHKKQYRKHSGLPYITHPIGVMMVLSNWGVDEEDLFIAAICHDLIEDTNVKEENILNLFGSKISRIVYLLTKQNDDNSESYLKRLEDSKNIDAMIIKIADRLYNYYDFIREGKDAKEYFNKIRGIIDYVFLNKDQVDIRVITNIKIELEQKGLIL